MQPGTLKRLLVLEINIRDYSEYLKILPLWVMLQTKATFFRYQIHKGTVSINDYILEAFLTSSILLMGLISG